MSVMMCASVLAMGRAWSASRMCCCLREDGGVHQSSPPFKTSSQLGLPLVAIMEWRLFSPKARPLCCSGWARNVLPEWTQLRGKRKRSPYSYMGALTYELVPILLSGGKSTLHTSYAASLTGSLGGRTCSGSLILSSYQYR